MGIANIFVALLDSMVYPNSFGSNRLIWAWNIFEIVNVASIENWWLFFMWCTYLIFYFHYRNLPNLQENKKAKEEIKKQLKELIMSNKNVNTNIEESARKVKKVKRVKISSLFTYFWWSVLIHFKTAGVILVRKVKNKPQKLSHS